MAPSAGAAAAAVDDDEEETVVVVVVVETALKLFCTAEEGAGDDGTAAAETSTLALDATEALAC